MSIQLVVSLRPGISQTWMNDSRINHPNYLSNTISKFRARFTFPDIVVNGQQRHPLPPPQHVKMNQQSIPPQQHNERLYYNPSRRKATLAENRASTYNMNRYQNRIIGKHNGCPWRPSGCVYPPGVMGYVP